MSERTGYHATWAELVFGMRFHRQLEHKRGCWPTGQAIENAKEGGAFDDPKVAWAGAEDAAC